MISIDSGEGTWTPNRIARQLPKTLNCGEVWAIGLMEAEDDEYVYAVTKLDAIEMPLFGPCVSATRLLAGK